MFSAPRAALLLRVAPAALLIGLLAAGQARAETFTVTNKDDAGAGSLRRAMADANNRHGSDTIRFAPGLTGTITISTSLSIESNMTIAGPGADQLTVASGGQGRVLAVRTPANASVSGLTISGGFVKGRDITDNRGQDATGGGIINEATLTLEDVVVRGNGVRAGNGGVRVNPFGGSTSFDGGDALGGGVFNSGTLTLKRTVVSGNKAVAGEGGSAQSSPTKINMPGRGGVTFGAGIRNTGTLDMVASEVRGNEAVGGDAFQDVSLAGPNGHGGNVLGGGISNNGRLTIQRSTVAGNSAQGGDRNRNGRYGSSYGAGIGNWGSLALDRSTVGANKVEWRGGAGGGVFNDATQVSVYGSTINANQAPAGASLFDGEAGRMAVLSSIVSGAQGGGANCDGGRFNSNGFNLEPGSSCGFGQPTDKQNTDPQLGSLADNGGPTRTYALPSSSPAVDQGEGAGVGVDQRGKERPVVFADKPKPLGGDGSDIGAYEVQVIRVTNTDDSGPGSVRAAVAEANQPKGANTIMFAPSVRGEIDLTSGQLQLSGGMRIIGPGPDKLTISGEHRSRVFSVGRNESTISGLTISDGNGSGTNYAGGIRNDTKLTLSHVVVIDNLVATRDARFGHSQTALGGGIRNIGDLTLIDSTVSDNKALGGVDFYGDGSAYGGGIENEAQLTIIGSTVSGNLARAGDHVLGVTTSYGGGIENGGESQASAVLAMTNSTVSDNESRPGTNLILQRPGDSFGGGIQSYGATSPLIDVTIAGNKVGEADSGANIEANGSEVNLRSSIVADPQGAPNCLGEVISHGFNLEQGNSCHLSQPTDMRNTDPQLQPLDDNGGPTETRAIPLSSPAVDQGSSPGVNKDQRRQMRPVLFPNIPRPAGGDGSDIGAFEFQRPPGKQHHHRTA